jgi:two-component system sensor histidine kinase MtrB
MEDTKLHNGWLQAWGNKGKGANFRLTVPLRQGEEIDKSPVQLEPKDIVLPGVPQNRDVLVLGPASSAAPSAQGAAPAPGGVPGSAEAAGSAETGESMQRGSMHAGEGPNAETPHGEGHERAAQRPALTAGPKDKP